MAFQKGHTPWNKDLKIQLNSGRTHFKKGASCYWKGKKFSDGYKEKLRLAWIKRREKGLGVAWNKGISCAEKTRKKLSIALMGREPNSGSFNKGLIPWNKDKKMPHLSGENNPSKRLGVREKISMALKGRIFSDEWKIRISNGKRGIGTGKNHWNWRGGISSLRQLLGNTIEYKQWRESIFKRDDFTCQWCRKRGTRLHVDHIKMFSFLRDKNNVKTVKDALNCKVLWDLNNGQTLCKKCHNWKTKMDFKIYKGSVPELNLVYFN